MSPGVVVESVSVEHVEHGVAPDGEERCAHPLEVLGVDSCKAHEHLGLAHDFVGPLFLVKVGPMAVTDGVRGDLMAVGVQILNLKARDALRIVAVVVPNCGCRNAPPALRFTQASSTLQPVEAEVFTCE